MYHDDIRVNDIKNLYIHLLKYGCHVTECKEVYGSYLVAVSGKAGGEAYKFFILTQVAERREWMND